METIALIEEAPERVLFEVSTTAWTERRSEWGGLLFGGSYEWGGKRFVIVSAAVPALGDGTPVSFEFDPQSYVLAQRLLPRDGGCELLEIGLWHSHPHIGVTPSMTDLEYQALVFPQVGSIGIIVDPFAPAVAAYAVQEEEVVQVAAYGIPDRRPTIETSPRLIRAWDLAEVRRALA